MIYYFLMIFSLIFSFLKNYLHFMNILIIFESFILIIFLLMNNFQELYMLMMFCVFSVCESSMGLTLMIVMIRCNGNDYCSLKLLTC